DARGRYLERAVRRQTGTVERSCLNVFQFRRYRDSMRRWSLEVLSVSPIHHESCHHNTRAERFAVGGAVLARATGETGPGNAGAVAQAEVPDTGPEFPNYPYSLVSEDQRELAEGPLACCQM